MNMKDGYNHILTHVGYDKALTYQDCEPCHRGHTALTGPYLGDLIHAAHYGSKVFQEANGNCWSCHAMNSAGGQGDYQLVLWDDFYDEPALGGYPNIDGNEMEPGLGRLPRLLRRICERHDPGRGARHRCQARPGCHRSRRRVHREQPWGPEVTEKNGEPFSFEAVCSDENTVSLTGVKNPRSFTNGRTSCHAPDRVHHGGLACATNGRGGSLVSNIPMSGVSVAYLIEQCGGLAGRRERRERHGYDGCRPSRHELEASTYTGERLYRPEVLRRGLKPG